MLLHPQMWAGLVWVYFPPINGWMDEIIDKWTKELINELVDRYIE